MSKAGLKVLAQESMRLLKNTTIFYFNSLSSFPFRISIGTSSPLLIDKSIVEVGAATKRYVVGFDAKALNMFLFYYTSPSLVILSLPTIHKSTLLCSLNILLHCLLLLCRNVFIFKFPCSQ